MTPFSMQAPSAVPGPSSEPSPTSAAGPATSLSPSSPASGSPARAPTIAACTPCRLVKMKCTREPHESVCIRCKRKNLSCVYETHRRGRRPGTKLRPKAERERERISTTLSTSSYADASASGNRPVIAGVFDDPNNANTVANATVPGLSLLSPTPLPTALPSRLTSKSENANWRMQNSELDTDKIGTEGTKEKSQSRTPFGLLRRSAPAGRFAIANILNDAEEDQADGVEDRNEPDTFQRYGIETSESEETNEKDPVTKGLLPLDTAELLLDSFLRHINPLVCHFDPRLHTLQYIRRSAFLTTALLAAAAKHMAMPLYPKLRAHAESMLRDILSSGQKSAEIVQGICLLTFWKEPVDARAWLLIGYAIRACIEMGWHKLDINSEDDLGMFHGHEKEIEIRERRNKERTWLMLFVHDRSDSLQLGKPWMIQVDTLIRSSETWCTHPLAVTGCDQVTSAFVQLRIIGSDLLDLFWADIHAPPVSLQTTGSPHVFGLSAGAGAGASVDTTRKNEVILKLLATDLDRWMERWIPVVDEATAVPAQRFLVRFYGAHLRLMLSSHELQLSIFAGRFTKHALWVSYTNAFEMLKLVVDRFDKSHSPSSPRPQAPSQNVPSDLHPVLIFHDPVHAMVAYAVIVVIKILMSLPGELPPDPEIEILELILNAAQVFGRRNPAEHTSAFSQSRFMVNVVAHYRRHRQQSDTIHGQTSETTVALRPKLGQGNQQHSPELRYHASNPNVHAGLLQGIEGQPALPTIIHPQSPSHHIAAFNPPDQLRLFHSSTAETPQWRRGHTVNSPNASALQPISGPGDLGEETKETRSGISAPLFTDHLAWEQLFASAGFNIATGSFVPPSLQVVMN